MHHISLFTQVDTHQDMACTKVDTTGVSARVLRSLGRIDPGAYTWVTHMRILQGLEEPDNHGNQLRIWWPDRHSSHAAAESQQYAILKRQKAAARDRTHAGHQAGV